MDEFPHKRLDNQPRKQKCVTRTDKPLFSNALLGRSEIKYQECVSAFMANIWSPICNGTLMHRLCLLQCLWLDLKQILQKGQQLCVLNVFREMFWLQNPSIHQNPQYRWQVVLRRHLKNSRKKILAQDRPWKSLTPLQSSLLGVMTHHWRNFALSRCYMLGRSSRLWQHIKIIFSPELLVLLPLRVTKKKKKKLLFSPVPFQLSSYPEANMINYDGKWAY